MISILRSIRERDRTDADQLLQKSIECYLAAMQLMQKHAVQASADELREYREKLATIHREVFTDVSVPALERSRIALEQEAEAYSAKVVEHYAATEQEVKQIMALVTEATGALMERNAQHNGEVRGFAVQMEATVQCEDLRQIRVQLSQQVEKLRTCADNFRDESAAALTPLQQELVAFEERLQAAERMASTDALTEVCNRREGEKRLRERIRSGRVFCLLVIDLNRFKWINDRYGHNCGDQVLKIVAKKLEEQVRPSDTVCRWGGDEFLIIMDCGLKDAMTRSRQIGECLRGRYAVNVGGRRTEVEVSGCCGVAGYNPGETMEQLFERADAMLYQIKEKVHGGIQAANGR